MDAGTSQYTSSGAVLTTKLSMRINAGAVTSMPRGWNARPDPTRNIRAETANAGTANSSFRSGDGRGVEEKGDPMVAKVFAQSRARRQPPLPPGARVPRGQDAVPVM